MLRRFIIAFATVVAFGIWFGATASADPYKWCAVYNMFGGGRDCGFVTIEQCRATISGIGGDCELNLFYTGPDEKPAKRRRKRHHDMIDGLFGPSDAPMKVSAQDGHL